MSMNKNRFWRGLKKGLMYFIAIFAAMVTFFADCNICLFTENK